MTKRRLQRQSPQRVRAWALALRIQRASAIGMSARIRARDGGEGEDKQGNSTHRRAQAICTGASSRRAFRVW
ncbi:hypothetical protein AURDEDRAFT_118112 [Auricularia subglabra TFB-10046 SS5]|uniref:Uncharacterized protein n=1 Tax=Auricularia subglabra (strain TFB-10046 / SS5) TaxID=717982 RepID=J0WJD8_AURST|nr:hypothetical protein AURDEDRAFT_118112 [Auricularia subglabra TFB-10046 SS5]